MLSKIFLLSLALMNIGTKLLPILLIITIHNIKNTGKSYNYYNNMQRRIFLHTVDHNPTDKKLNEKENFAALKKVRNNSFVEFRKALKLSSFNIKIVCEEELRPEIVIEYPDKFQWEVYEFLRTIDVVETIDNFV